MDFGHGRSGLKGIGLEGSQLEMEDYIYVYYMTILYPTLRKNLLRNFQG